MRRAIWLTFFGVLAFVAILIARLPASWVAPDASSGVTCSDIDGTVWNGTCIGLSANRQPVGDLTWELHPAALLAGKLKATVTLSRPPGGARGDVEVGFGKIITAHDIHADLPLDPTLMPQLPANLRGNLHADVSLLRLRGPVIRALEGEIEARNLEQGPAGAAEELGSYSLVFPPGSSGDPIGKLHDIGGPLAVEGSLRLTPEPGFDVQGLVAARPTASAELARDIQFLGSPDAQGRRLFSFAATF